MDVSLYFTGDIHFLNYFNIAVLDIFSKIH